MKKKWIILLVIFFAPSVVTDNADGVGGYSNEHEQPLVQVSEVEEVPISTNSVEEVEEVIE